MPGVDGPPRRVLLTGGGTLGSVTPLLAVAEYTQKRGWLWQFTFVGTRRGPERELVRQYQVPFVTIVEVKWRRYFDWRNFVTPFAFVVALCQALWLVRKFQPDVVVGAGGFVSVPLVLAARLHGRPAIIYQLDVHVGLTNRLLAPLAQRIAVAFRHHLYQFDRAKAALVGLIARPGVRAGSREHARVVLGVDSRRPVILVLGGGTGATAINQKVKQSLPQLVVDYQLIHLTGRGKSFAANASHYHQFQFLTDTMSEALAAADVVVCRAGLATIAELSALGKVSLIIPLPDSSQKANAEFLSRHAAAAVLAQETWSTQQFVDVIKRLLTDQALRQQLQRNIKKLYDENGLARFVELIKEGAA